MNTSIFTLAIATTLSFGLVGCTPVFSFRPEQPVTQKVRPEAEVAQKTKPALKLISVKEVSCDHNVTPCCQHRRPTNSGTTKEYNSFITCMQGVLEEGKDQVQRASAALMLMYGTTPQIELLVRVAGRETEPTQVRISAIWALEEMADVRYHCQTMKFFPQLPSGVTFAGSAYDHLSDDKPSLEMAASHLLGIATWRTHDDPVVRSAAASALRFFDYPETAPKLDKLIQKSLSYRVRLGALQGLDSSCTRPKSVTPGLMSTLSHPHHLIRVASVKILYSIRTPESLKLLVDTFKTESHEAVRSKIEFGLEHFGHTNLLQQYAKLYLRSDKATRKALLKSLYMASAKTHLIVAEFRRLLGLTQDKELRALIQDYSSHIAERQKAEADFFKGIDQALNPEDEFGTNDLDNPAQKPPGPIFHEIDLSDIDDFAE